MFSDNFLVWLVVAATTVILVMGIVGRRLERKFTEVHLADALGQWNGQEDDPELYASLVDAHGEETANALMVEVNDIRARIINAPDHWGGPLPQAWTNAQASFAEQYPSIKPEALTLLATEWAWRNR